MTSPSDARAALERAWIAADDAILAWEAHVGQAYPTGVTEADARSMGAEYHSLLDAKHEAGKQLLIAIRAALADVPVQQSGVVVNESGTWCPHCRREPSAEPCARCGLSRATIAHMTTNGVPLHRDGHIFESAADAPVPPATTEPPTCELCKGSGTEDGVLVCGWCDGTGYAATRAVPPATLSQAEEAEDLADARAAEARYAARGVEGLRAANIPSSTQTLSDCGGYSAVPPATEGETARLEGALRMLRWVDNELDKAGVPTVEDDSGELPGALLSQAGRVAKLAESRNSLVAVPALREQEIRAKAEAYIGAKQLFTGVFTVDLLVDFVQSFTPEGT